MSDTRRGFLAKTGLASLLALVPWRAKAGAVTFGEGEYYQDPSPMNPYPADAKVLNMLGVTFTECSIWDLLYLAMRAGYTLDEIRAGDVKFVRRRAPIRVYTVPDTWGHVSGWPS